MTLHCAVNWDFLNFKIQYNKRCCVSFNCSELMCQAKSATSDISFCQKLDICIDNSDKSTIVKWIKDIVKIYQDRK